MEPSELQDGTAATFEAAKIDFKQAWHEVVPKISEEAFRSGATSAMTAWKYVMQDRGLPLPTQMADQSRCFCGDRDHHPQRPSAYFAAACLSGFRRGVAVDYP
jgi:hypothetical protein